MSLPVDVTDLLRRGRAPFAVIGAAAMAVHGVSRATRDLDLLTLARTCLEPPFWQELDSTGVDVSVRRGMPMTRWRASFASRAPAWRRWMSWSESTPGRSRSRRRPPRRSSTVCTCRSRSRRISSSSSCTPEARSQDARDIAQLLELPDGDAVIGEVERRLPALPPECGRLWARLRAAER